MSIKRDIYSNVMMYLSLLYTWLLKEIDYLI